MEPEWVIRQGFACVRVKAPSAEAAVEIAAKRLGHMGAWIVGPEVEQEVIRAEECRDDAQAGDNTRSVILVAEHGVELHVHLRQRPLQMLHRPGAARDQALALAHERAQRAQLIGHPERPAQQPVTHQLPDACRVERAWRDPIVR